MTVRRIRQHSQPAIGAATDIPFYTVRSANPARTDVYRTSDNAWLATFTDGCRTATVLGPTRTFIEQVSSGLQDDFDRDLDYGVEGWGNTFSAGKWAVRTGDSTNYPYPGGMYIWVANSSARIAPSSYGYDYSHADVTVRVNFDHMAKGDSIYAGIMAAYQDTSNHYLATLAFDQAPNHGETFGGNTTDGWGVDETHGAAWQVSGTVSDYSVGSGVGVHNLTTTNVSRRSLIDTSSEVDGEVLTSFTFPTTPTGGSLFAGPILRYTDASNHYIVRLRKNYATDGSPNNVDLSLQKQVAGTITTLVTDTNTRTGGVAAGVKWWVRASAIGTALKAKAWPDSEAEPAGWDIDTTDASLSTGTRWGVRSITSTTTSNAPIAVNYSYWFVQTAPGDAVKLYLQKREAGTTTNLLAGYSLSLNEDVYREHIGDGFWIRCLREGSDLKAKAWKTIDGVEPVDWQIATTDSTFVTGDVGLRGYVQPAYTGSFPVEYTWGQYTVDAEWSNPPTVTHNKWVYVMDNAFTGVIDSAWLMAKLTHTDEDILSIMMQYIANATVVYRRSSDPALLVPATVITPGTAIGGEAGYGPLDGLGKRIEGSDFNDDIQFNVVYPSDGTDHAETAQVGCLDCSGYVRMVFGLRGGMPLQNTPVLPNRIPRVSFNISINPYTPGIIVFNNLTKPSTSELNRLQPGDLVAFDADTSNPNEEEGQIDHVGIYLGVDINGDKRFVSGRKSCNGPTFSDIGGTSKLNGTTALYAKSLRAARRF